jgi:Family of unknown function (DUF5856)
MIEEILVFRDLIQVYHWTTRNYEQHVAVGNLYDTLLPLIDSFFETYQMEDRIIFNKNIPLKNMNEKDFMNMIKSFSNIFFDTIFINDINLSNEPSRSGITNNSFSVLRVFPNFLRLIDRLRLCFI